jgi:Holliday junction resolvase RusA-like endonuclease
MGERRTYVIPGEPTAWSSHRGFGKKSFSPHYKQKEAAQYFLRKQHAALPTIKKALRVDFSFLMPIPKSMPKKILKRIQSGEKIYHIKRKDRSNCIKFAEDCLTGVVISDDNIICDGRAEKYYSENPQTIIVIEEIDGA